MLYLDVLFFDHLPVLILYSRLLGAQATTVLRHLTPVRHL